MAAAVAVISLTAAGCSAGDFMGPPEGLCSHGYDPIVRVNVQPSEVTLRIGMSVQIRAMPIGPDGEWALCAPHLP